MMAILCPTFYLNHMHRLTRECLQPPSHRRASPRAETQHREVASHGPGSGNPTPASLRSLTCLTPHQETVPAPASCHQPSLSSHGPWLSAPSLCLVAEP